ncbi:MAG: FAD-linked oxidase C-terminal domain-containing protein [Gammaproteobacteria bacterium]
MPDIKQQAFIRKLRKHIPASCILSESADLLPYECDGLSAYRQTPWLVALPETAAQVQGIVRCCHESSIAIVARGAGTGLSGGALPINNGLLLSLAKLKDILSIDPANRLATVQPGVRNIAITQAASKYGLYYAPDPSSQIACSIGGNVAENAGGVHCLKYGLTVHNIASLKIITIEGEQLTIGSAGFDSPGYDLLALLTGSEGLLGIITEVTVRLLPAPEFAQVILASFSTVEAAGDAVTAVISSGIIPAGLEIMDHLAIRAAEDFVHAGYPVDAAGLLLCELDGAKTEVISQMESVKETLQKAGANSLLIAKDEAERQRFWAGRKAAFPAVGRLAPDYYCMDGTIPRKHLGKVLATISQWSAEYGLPVANVFHAGDGNLHPLILYDANKPGELERTEEFGGRILELCISVGGTITGEHGVGMEKINQMCSQFTAAELQQFHAIKAAFDPEGLLNPGKAIPTLVRCAEFGQMHVHQGALPFPELERF